MNVFAVFAAVAALQGPTIPAPRGMVNDFAGVVDAGNAARIERIAAFVRARSGGEIVIVTLRDIGQADVGDVALRIGREWGVGSKAEVGDRARNAGVVVLVVPKETSSTGRGLISLMIGQGAEGFIPDAVAGDMKREAIPLFQQRDYGAALALITTRLAQRYAAEFAFSLDSVAAVPRVARRQGEDSGLGFGVVAVLVLLFVILPLVARGRRGRGSGLGGALPWIIASSMRRGGGGGFGGWSSGGGGGSGGGFGGFGGGGGFSGGGSSGSW